MKDNLCDNALDLTNGKLIVGNFFRLGTYCQWLISAQDDDAYVTLEFLNFNARKNLAHFVVWPGFSRKIENKISGYLWTWQYS